MNSPAAKPIVGLRHPDAVEREFARRIVVGLGGSQPTVDAHLERRLSAARWQALEAADRVRRLKSLALTSGLSLAQGASASTPWWARFASVLPVVALTLGLITIDQMNLLQRIEAAAEVDTALLADDLPPAAYTDPGFAEFLKQNRP